MGLISRVLAPREERALTATEALRRLVQSTVTRSGVSVNEHTALQLMAVFSAVRILAEAFSQVPLKVYRRMPDGSREEAREHPLYKILHDQPNAEMTSFTLREVMIAHLALWGNSYCEISRNFQGDAIGLWPLRPDRTRPMRTKIGALVYETRIQTDPNSQPNEIIILPARNVLHVPGLGFDGLKGLSVIGTAREGIGLAFAYEAFGSYFFGNNTVPGLILTTDQPMRKEQVDDLERRIKEGHEGLTNSQRLMILTSGLRPTTVGMPLEDAQFMEQKKYTRSEIMGLYRIPPHMSNDTEKVSSWGTGIEQMSIGFVTYTMMPYFKRFEQAINMKLFGANAQAPLYPEFDASGFLRGDFKTRMDGYAIARQWGWLSVNDIKRKENEPGIGAQGDVYLSPSGYVPADRLGDVVDKQVAPAPTPVAAPIVRNVETRPIGPYPNWDACIADQLSKGRGQESAEKICGALENSEVAHSYRYVLADVTDRILRRERQDVSRGIEKMIKKGALVEVPIWLEGFYQDHRAWAVAQATPVFAGIADALCGGRDIDRSSYADATRAAAAGYVERLCAESMDDLRRAIRGEGELVRILSAWERRADAIAGREVDAAITIFTPFISRQGGRAVRAPSPITVNNILPEQKEEDEMRPADVKAIADAVATSIAAAMRNMAAPVVNVNVPDQAAPVVTVQVPEQRAPDVVVNVPEQRPPDITVQVPEQPVPTVTVQVPEQRAPEVHVNVDEGEKEFVRDTKGLITGTRPKKRAK